MGRKPDGFGGWDAGVERLDVDRKYISHVLKHTLQGELEKGSGAAIRRNPTTTTQSLQDTGFSCRSYLCASGLSCFQWPLAKLQAAVLVPLPVIFNYYWFF